MIGTLDAVCVFKLRQNIELENDLVLAKMELEALLGTTTIREVSNTALLMREFPELGCF